MMRRPWNLFVPLFLALSVMASSCGGGGGPEQEITKIRETDGRDVQPPGRADPRAVALPGLLLDSNSSTWRRLIDAPGGSGAVVLFVQPGGPSDRRGIARGDLITEVEGTRVINDEHALALLWSHRGESRRVKFAGRGGREREIEIKNDLPRREARPFLDVMIEGNKTDPVLRYVRAQTAGATDAQNLADLDVALREEPRFVEALAHKGSILFNERTKTDDEAKRTEATARALAAWTNAIDIDPRHAKSLALQSIAFTSTGNPTRGRSDALKALKIDGTLPLANHALARANLSLKRPADAAGPARAALAGNPYSNLTYYRTLAATFRELKRKEDCARTLSAIVPWLEGTRSDALRKEAKQIENEAKTNCG